MEEEIKEEKQKYTPAKFVGNKLVINDSSQLDRVANMLAKSNLIPNHLKNKPSDVSIILMHGMELGLSPMMSLSNVYVVEGTPTVSAAAMRSMVEASNLMIDIKITYKEKDNEVYECVCSVLRKGRKSFEEHSFSMDDAKKAQLASKQNWIKYPKRMLYARAVSYAMRSVFGDVTKGFLTIEEMEDSVGFKDVSPSKTAKIDDVELEIKEFKPERSEEANEQKEEKKEEGVNMPAEKSATAEDYSVVGSLI